MKNKARTRTLLQTVLIVLGFNIYLSACSFPVKDLRTGQWHISYNNKTKGIDIKSGEKLICNNMYASYKLSGKSITSKDYLHHEIHVDKINDSIGKGTCMKITYTSQELPTLTQYFYAYPQKEYVLTEFTLESAGGISSNYMAPVNIDTMPGILNKSKNNRALFIPFDNDKWLRYSSQPLKFDKQVSYEVTAIFNNNDRHGLVVGSVEHDNWKTAISIGKGDINNVGSLACFGGAADEQTRDSKPHGMLTGICIKSPKILLGFFDNWCNGLEEYARVNAIIAPPKAWNKAVPFGWNSWGVLQFGLTGNKAIEVSDYIKQKLQDKGFVNPDNTLYIGLDSGWNNFTEEELRAFVNNCRNNGQVAGAYWTPFTDWSRNAEQEVDNAPGYHNKDIYLYANGKPQELDGAYAIDPTHPAIEERMRQVSTYLRELGFEYIKMDFMTHGAMEADKWHNPGITTGMQAYNYGMQLLNKYFDGMYINLSISPVFPAQYAHSRRIACDAWNKIKDTEYTLNALSYGWWQNYIYSYNDADHIVLKEATEGENRARITSAIITGLYILGDDYSNEGSTEGKVRSEKFLINREINSIANGKSFRPVEGNGEESENKFVRMEADSTCYCAVFNYANKEQKIAIIMERLGLNGEQKYRVKELWRRTETLARQQMDIVVPAKDVMLLRIEKKY